MCPEQLFQWTLIELPSFYRNSYLQVNLSTCVGKGKKKKTFAILIDYDILCITAGQFHSDKELSSSATALCSTKENSPMVPLTLCFL